MRVAKCSVCKGEIDHFSDYVVFGDNINRLSHKECWVQFLTEHKETYSVAYEDMIRITKGGK
jgi:hypothetical protein